MTAVSYAQALYMLSEEEKVSKEIFAQISAVSYGFSDNPNLSKILDRPGSSYDENCRLIDKCFSGFNKHLVNCIKVMCKHRVTSFVPQVSEEFMKIYRKENGIEIVNVTTAVELDDETKQKLKTKLEGLLNKDVELKTNVNPEVIGGVVLNTETMQIDGSIKTRVKNMENQIKSAMI